MMYGNDLRSRARKTLGKHVFSGATSVLSIWCPDGGCVIWMWEAGRFGGLRFNQNFNLWIPFWRHKTCLGFWVLQTSILCLKWTYTLMLISWELNSSIGLKSHLLLLNVLGCWLLHKVMSMDWYHEDYGIRSCCMLVQKEFNFPYT